MKFVRSIILMKGATTLAQFSRLTSYCAHGIGKLVDGFAKQHVVLTSIVRKLTTSALFPRVHFTWRLFY